MTGVTFSVTELPASKSPDEGFTLPRPGGFTLTVKRNNTVSDSPEHDKRVKRNRKISFFIQQSSNLNQLTFG